MVLSRTVASAPFRWVDKGKPRSASAALTWGCCLAGWPPTRSLVSRPAAELAAVELASGALLWRRRVDTRGLLNIVASPGLGEASSYRAMASAGGVAASGGATATTTTTTASGGDTDGQGGGHERKRRAMESGSSKLRMGVESGSGSEGAASGGAVAGGGARVHDSLALGINNSEVILATQQLIDMGYRPKTNGKWSSGQPRLDLKTKNSDKSWEAGISLPLLQVNIDKLRVRCGRCAWCGAGARGVWRMARGRRVGRATTRGAVRGAAALEWSSCLHCSAGWGDGR
jgi:hypothetical protein